MTGNGKLHHIDLFVQYSRIRESGEHVTQLAEYVLHELHRGGFHRTVGINGERDVVNVLSLLNGTLHAHVLIFAPGEMPAELVGHDILRLRSRY